MGRRRRRRILFIIEIIVLVIVVIVLIYYNQRINTIQVEDVEESKIAVNDIEEETLVEFQGFETIAVFGLDNRDLGYYDFGNTDVIMIINIDNDTKEVNMVSVYRDTFLNIAPAGESADYEKANSAFNEGGVSQAINMLNQNLDLDIDNYVCVDFRAVEEAINILGGVDIDITSDYELQYLNEYIGATNDILGTDSPLVDSVGVHTLDGTQAVSYTRIRYTTGGDYKRAWRQRVVLSEMLDKAKDANLSQIDELINAIFPEISTDMSQRELLSMATAVLGYDLGESRGFPFSRTDMELTDMTNGDIVVPCTLESNVIELHEMLFGTGNYTPSPQVQAYSEYIVERTGKDESSGVDDQYAYADDYEGDETGEVEDGYAEGAPETLEEADSTTTDSSTTSSTTTDSSTTGSTSSSSTSGYYY